VSIGSTFCAFLAVPQIDALNGFTVDHHFHTHGLPGARLLDIQRNDFEFLPLRLDALCVPVEDELVILGRVSSSGRALQLGHGNVETATTGITGMNAIIEVYGKQRRLLICMNKHAVIGDLLLHSYGCACAIESLDSDQLGRIVGFQLASMAAKIKTIDPFLALF